MEIPDELRCVFSANVDEHHGSYRIELPKREIRDGSLDQDSGYRIALLATSTDSVSDDSSTEDPTKTEPQSDRTTAGPPVEEGEIREVEIETLGDQGDGIARVERGYVIIVPGAEIGERVTIEITTVRENVAFSDVVERTD